MSLAEALLKVQGAVAKVEKVGTNPHTNSRYPTLEAVLDVLNGPLQENGVLVVQFPVFIDGQWILRTKVSVKAEACEMDMPLLGIDSSKNQMQALGSAMSYARRYSLMAFFKLAPTDDDAEASNLTFSKEKPKPEPEKPKVKNYAPKAKDMKIPDGKFKGKMASAVPKEELGAYIETVRQAMEQSGKNPPKWFHELVDMTTVREASAQLEVSK